MQQTEVTVTANAYNDLNQDLPSVTHTFTVEAKPNLNASFDEDPINWSDFASGVSVVEHRVNISPAFCNDCIVEIQQSINVAEEVDVIIVADGDCPSENSHFYFNLNPAFAGGDLEIRIIRSENSLDNVTLNAPFQELRPLQVRTYNLFQSLHGILLTLQSNLFAVKDKAVILEKLLSMQMELQQNW